MKTKLMLSFLMLYASGILAQNTKTVKTRPTVNNLGVWKKFENDTLKIRWFPAYPVVWDANNRVGYFIERAEIKKGATPVFVKLNNTPIIPKKEISANKTDTEVIGNQAIFNDDMKTTVDDAVGNNASNRLNLRHYFAMYASFKSFKTAKKMALGFEDVSFEKNKMYLYRVYANSDNKNLAAKNDTSYITFNPKEKNLQKLPPRLDKEEIEKAVFLTWPAKAYQRNFALYHIERSENGVDFERISKAPVSYSNSKVNISYFKDSLGINYKPYFYRLSGMDFFGEWYSSKAIIVAQGVDKTPPTQPKIESSKYITDHKVQIKWSMPILDTDLKGFYVTKSNSLNSKAIKISKDLSLNTHEFTDSLTNLETSYNYLVFAVDTSGNEKASFPIYVTATDTTAPLKPIGLKGTSSPKGIVQLTWDKNTGKDIKGYYVYFANDPAHEFSQITHNLLTDNKWSDTITLRSLTKKVYYRIVAMDTHFNRSFFSDVLAVNRPDIIPPAAPLIIAIDVKDSTATIQWQSSPSNDVSEYQLYRKEPKKDWVLLKAYKKGEINTRTFTDATLRTEISYEYSIMAIDDSGLRSERSLSRFAKAHLPAYLPVAPTPVITYLKEENINRITWQYPYKNNYKVAIYRSVAGNDNYHLIGFADHKAGEFLDKPLGKGDFKYIIRSIHTNGKYSVWSKEVIVKM